MASHRPWKILGWTLTCLMWLWPLRSIKCSQGDPGSLQPSLQKAPAKEPKWPPPALPNGVQLLSYIYLVRCDLTQEQLPAFMATGKQLEVEGLFGNLDERNEHVEENGDYLKSRCHLQEERYWVGKKYWQWKDASRQEPRCDEIEDGLLDDNVNAIFQDQIVMPNNDKSILTSNSHTLQKEIQCQFCDYKPANAGNIKHHVENEHQGLK